MNRTEHQFPIRHRIDGIDRGDLAAALATGIDHGGNPIEPFTDDEGGWPLRCCLDDSRPGDSIAIIAWNPFPWTGPYAEVGPIVVHTEGCDGPNGSDRLPEDFETRPMTLRPYGGDRRIAYSKVRHIPAAEPLTAHVVEMLADPDIELIHGRNLTGGCFSFQARRLDLDDDSLDDQDTRR